MPFFTSSQYLDTPQRFWIWIVLTIPSTIFAFFIYRRVMQKETAKYKLVDTEAPPEEDDDDGVDNSGNDSPVVKG
jgi:hypothetical protein